MLHEVTVTLSAAHGRSLFHGALRPASVFLTIDGNRVTGVKLLDFGVASDASQLDDLYALGALAFAMLTGVSAAPPAPLPMPIAPGVPPELATLIEDLRKPEKLRPQTANEVRTRLGAMLPPPPATEPPAPAAIAAPVPKRLPMRAIARAAGGALVIAAAALFFSSPGAPSQEPRGGGADSCAAAATIARACGGGSRRRHARGHPSVPSFRARRARADGRAAAPDEVGLQSGGE